MEPGNYNVVALYIGYDSLLKKGIVISKGSVYKLDFTFAHSNNHILTGDIRTTIYSKPVLDMDNPTKRTFTRKEIDNTPK